MKRYPAFDPPEYVHWSPDPEVMTEYRRTIEVDEARRALIAALSPEKHLALYRGLVRNRLLDTMLKRWVRQGVISKAWLGTGEEAVTVGAAHALVAGDQVGPMIRNTGAYSEMGMRVVDVLRAHLGTDDSPSRGRDIHLGDLARGVVAPISMVGSLVPVCAGVALSFKLRGQDHVALTWSGDGTTRTTAFHEGLICARSLRLPLIVVVQNNQIALGTTHEAHSRAPVEAVAGIYGAPSYSCDGNHVLDVYAATSLAAQVCRAGNGPVLVNAKTFRMGGHATHDEADSRHILMQELFDHWGRRDPVGMYEAYLAETDLPLSKDFTNREALERAEAEVTAEVEQAAEEALISRARHQARPESQAEGVFSGDSSRL